LHAVDSSLAQPPPALPQNEKTKEEKIDEMLKKGL